MSQPTCFLNVFSSFIALVALDVNKQSMLAVILVCHIIHSNFTATLRGVILIFIAAILHLTFDQPGKEKDILYLF